MENAIVVGTQLHTIVLPLLTLFFTIVSVSLFAMMNSEKHEGKPYVLFSVPAAVLAIIFFIATLTTVPALTGPHTKIYHVNGVVTHASTTVDSNGLSVDRPIIELDTVDRPITFRNDEASKLVGKNVTLTCTTAPDGRVADVYRCDLYLVH